MQGILRHTTSDPVSRVASSRSHTLELGDLDQPRASAAEGNTSGSVKEAARSNTTDLSFCRDNEGLTRPTSLSIPEVKTSQPLVKILLPDDHNDSDDTLIEEKHETESSKEAREDGVSPQKPKRVLPPPLADWNRSQSFPPAVGKNSSSTATRGLEETNFRRRESGELGESSVSLVSTSSSSPGRGLRHDQDFDLIQAGFNILKDLFMDRKWSLEQKTLENLFKELKISHIFWGKI